MENLKPKDHSYIELSYNEDTCYGEMSQFQINLSNSEISSCTGFDVAKGSLILFAKEMSAFFPLKNNEEIIFNSKDSDYSGGSIKLRVFKYNPMGKLAIEVKIFDDSHYTFISHTCHFFIETRSSDINTLGKKLLEWLNTDMSKSFYFDWLCEY